MITRTVTGNPLTLCLIGYIAWRKHKAKLQQMEQEILISKLRLADSQNRLEIIGVR